MVPLYQAKTELFRALGNPVRIRVLELLYDGPNRFTGCSPRSRSRRPGCPSNWASCAAPDWSLPAATATPWSTR